MDWTTLKYLSELQQNLGWQKKPACARRRSVRRRRKTKSGLTILYECFEQVNSDLADVDKKFDTKFEEMEEAMEKVTGAQQFAEIALQAASDTRGHRRRLATSFDEAEVALNEG